LRDSPSDLIENYKKYNFTIPATQSIIGIEENHKFQLGNISLRILHTPGHSSDSICLLTNKGELFIGDVAYYGEQFLPERENFSNVLDTLSRLISLVEKRGNIEIYPSHDGLPCDKTLLTDLYDGIKNIDQIWEQKRINPFFSAYELEDDKFKYYVKKNYNNH
jgi:glyoxylase-like metal-dependent hydrolase (beta-lactamase superfamily II)